MYNTTDCRYSTVRIIRAVPAREVSGLVAQLSVTALPTFVILEQEQPVLYRQARKEGIAPGIQVKEELLNDVEQLASLYAEFAEEDLDLAQTGLGHYARLLANEESTG